MTTFFLMGGLFSTEIAVLGIVGGLLGWLLKVLMNNKNLSLMAAFVLGAVGFIGGGWLGMYINKAAMQARVANMSNVENLA